MTPQELTNAARCYSCIPAGASQSVILYLLNQIAGTGLTPQQLLEASKCYLCLPDGASKATTAYLLNQILQNGGGGTGILEAATVMDYLYLADLNPSVDALELQVATVGGDFDWVTDADAVTVSMPNLTSVGGYFTFWGWASMTTLSMPLLATVVGNFTLDPNPVLANLDLSSFLPTNGTDIAVSGCDLTAASVNHVLARCVANAGYVTGNVVMNGGTNSAPTGQGITDKNTLTARGVTVVTN